MKAINTILENFSSKITKWAGTSWAFSIAMFSIIIWLLIGPIFNYSDSWQLYANTVSTLITYCMLFLLQRGQNKESVAIQLKLNELLAAHENASNKMIGIELLNETQVKELNDRFKKLAEKVKEEGGGHTIEEIPPPNNSTLTWMTDPD